MPLPVDERRFLESIAAPGHAEVRAAADKFLAFSGLSVTDLAEAVNREYGRCARVTLLFWFRDVYGPHRKNGEHIDNRWLDARVWDYIQRHWPQRRRLDAPADVLLTRGYHQIREVFLQALESGVNAVISGPPASEKSEVLTYLVAQRQAAGRDDAIYIQCDVTLTSPLALLRRICRELGVIVSRTVISDDYLMGIVEHLRRRERLPVLVLDEAQHLPVRALEAIRGIHTHTRRRAAQHHGCAFLLAGSHDLAAQFEHPRTRSKLEQLSSRIPIRLRLTGMTAEEALTLAARAFGNGRPAKLSDVQKQTLLADCTALDEFTLVCEKCRALWKRGAQKCSCGQAKPVPMRYYSPRRLLEFVRQKRRHRADKITAPEITEVA